MCCSDALQDGLRNHKRKAADAPAPDLPDHAPKKAFFDGGLGDDLSSSDDEAD